MTERHEFLNRLQSKFVCGEAWDAMPGSGSCRFCNSCRHEVHDFARLRPREVRARLEAGKGKLCARLTRVDGRLQLLPAAQTSPGRPLLSGRVSPFAATLLGAWLGAGAAAAQPSLPPRADAALVAEPLPTAGGKEEPALRLRDEVVVTSAAPEVTTTIGALYVTHLNLRQLFVISDLVVLAVVEDSKILGIDEGYADKRTRLRIVRRFKGGNAVEAVVSYRHSESSDQDPAESVREGAPVLAFLSRKPDDTEASWTQDFETMDFQHGLRELEGAALDAYQERLDALAALERRGKHDAFGDSAALMEWLVATAEDPHTRHEALEEIENALEAFAELAERLRRNPETAAADFERMVEAGDEKRILLGSAFSDRHRQRLEAALLSTQEMNEAELALYELVRDWNRGVR